MSAKQSKAAETERLQAKANANVARSIRALGLTDEQLRRSVSLKTFLEGQAMVSEYANAIAADASKKIDELKALVDELTARTAAIEATGIKFQGTWQRANGYRRGAVVSHGGSAWCCIKDHEVPETPGASEVWQLMVKKGADAKDAGR